MYFRWRGTCREDRWWLSYTVGGLLRPPRVVWRGSSRRIELTPYNQIMKKTTLTFVLTFTASAAFAQNASQVQKLFEAGEYQRVVEAAQPDADPAVLYTAAQSHQKLGDNDQALQTYGALASRDAGDVWHFIGLSAQQLMQDDTEGAVGSARQAVAMNGGMAEAHYQ